jgi:hypothetical protein
MLAIKKLLGFRNMQEKLVNYLSFFAGLQSILDETAVIVQTNPFGCDP